MLFMLGAHQCCTIPYTEMLVMLLTDANCTDSTTASEEVCVALCDGYEWDGTACISECCYNNILLAMIFINQVINITITATSEESFKNCFW